MGFRRRTIVATSLWQQIKSSTAFGNFPYGHRTLCCTKRSLTRTKTHSTYLKLNGFKDKSSFLESEQRNPEELKILILNPEQTTDRKYERLVDLHTEGSPNDNLSLDAIVPIDIVQEKVDAQTCGDSTIQKSIERLRPNAKEITTSRFERLAGYLSISFAKSQLKKFIENAYKDAKYNKVRRGISRQNKDKLARIIIQDIWGLKITNKLSTIEDLITTRSIRLTRSQLYLLLLQNGFIIQYVSRTGAKISFDAKERAISFRGTENQVTNAEIILNAILSKAYKERVDLSSLKHLFLAKYGTFSLDIIGKNTEVYFDHLGNDIYDLIALNVNQIKRSKRLLLWLLDHNLHLREDLYIDNCEDTKLFPFQDDDALAWHDRQHDLFILKSQKPANLSNIMSEQFISYCPHVLNRNNLEFESEIEDVKSSPPTENAEGLVAMDLEESLANPKSDADGKENIMNKMTLGNSESSFLKPDSLVNKFSSVNKSSKLRSIALSDSFIDTLYEKLTDFSYREVLHGLSSGMNPPVFTVTFGNILFKNNEKGDLIDHIIPRSPELSPNVKSNYSFNSNIPLISDKVLSLPSYDKPTLDTHDINHYLNKDPHLYSIQLKFLPSPFEQQTNGRSVDEQMKYPPIEIWAQLNENSKPDLETMSVVTVEGEKVQYLGFPESKSDMKVCCQVSADLLSGNKLFNFSSESNDSDINAILQSPTSKYSQFLSQPGLSQFVEKSVLDFSGKVATSIAPSVDFIINGEPVRYHYINITFRRLLDFAISSSQGSNLVQLNLAEGGSLGGRRVEVNLVGDLVNTLSPILFREMMQNASKFINGL